MFRQLVLVAKQTYRIRFKSLSFWTLILSPFLIGLLTIGIIALVQLTQGDSTQRLAVINQPQVLEVIKASHIKSLSPKSMASQEQAKKAIKADKIDAYLTASSSGYQLVTTSKSAANFPQKEIQTILTQIERAKVATSLNLNAQDLASLSKEAQLDVVTENDKGQGLGGEGKAGANYFVSIFIGIVIFIFLTSYIGIISQEIANEKSSRIMETLLAASSTQAQYYGKIVGIFGLALTQMVIYILGFGLGFGQLKQHYPEQVAMVAKVMNKVDLSFVLIAVVFILLAILGFLALASIVSSLVNDQSQAQQATQPVIYLAMIPYMLSFVMSSSPDSLVLKVLSYVPMFSPTLMTSRYALEFGSFTELLLALSLQLLAVVAILFFGQKLYARNVLSYSEASIWQQLLPQQLRGHKK